MLQTPVSFSLTQRILHWVVALLVFFNLLFPDGMNRWAHAAFRGDEVTPEMIASANIHAYVGMTVLVLALIRLALRFIQGVPAEPQAEPPLLRKLSRLAHWTFYLLFIALPLTGMLGYYLGVTGAADAHGGPLKALMWILLVLHVGAVAIHQFYWKTGILKRMTTG